MRKKLIIFLIVFFSINLFLGAFIFNNTTTKVSEPLSSKEVSFLDDLSSFSGSYICYRGKKGVYGNIESNKSYSFNEEIYSGFLGEKGEVYAFKTSLKIHIYRLGYKKASINLSKEFNFLGITTRQKASHGGIVYQPKDIVLYKNGTIYSLNMDGEVLSTKHVGINKPQLFLEGEKVVFRNKSVLKIFSIKQNTFLDDISIDTMVVDSLEFSRNGYYLSILDKNNSLKCYVLPNSGNISQIWENNFTQKVKDVSISDTAKNTLVNTAGHIYQLNRDGEIKSVFEDKKKNISMIYAKNNQFLLGQDNLIKLYRNDRSTPLTIYKGDNFVSIIRAEEDILGVLKENENKNTLLSFSSKESILNGNKLLWAILLTSIIFEITFFYLTQKRGIDNSLKKEIKYFLLGGSIGFLFYLLIFGFKIEGLISFISTGLVTSLYLSNIQSSYFKVTTELVDVFFDVIISFVLTTLISPLIGVYTWAFDTSLIYNLLSKMFFEFIRGSMYALVFSVFGALISLPIGIYLLRKNK
ncbi:hypothetical protein C9439_01030 [archaeon SCG-AAA382B04]|nr:hypothetical protein C9439_01030 [archaeon SCG-AAA382B04]